MKRIENEQLVAGAASISGGMNSCKNHGVYAWLFICDPFGVGGKDVGSMHTQALEGRYKQVAGEALRTKERGVLKNSTPCVHRKIPHQKIQHPS